MTNKQIKFCQEYIKDNNATQAAKRAGYSVKTADRIGNVLLRNVEVKAEIEKLRGEIKSDDIAEAKEILAFLTSVMRGEETAEALKGIGDGAQELIKCQIKPGDKLKAAELLGKSCGIFVDKSQVTGNLNFEIKIDYGE